MSQDYFYEQQLDKLKIATDYKEVGFMAWCDQLTDELVAQHGTILHFIYDDVVNISEKIMHRCMASGKLEVGAMVIYKMNSRIVERLMNSYGFMRPEINQAFTPM